MFASNAEGAQSSNGTLPASGAVTVLSMTATGLAAPYWTVSVDGVTLGNLVAPNAMNAANPVQGLNFGSWGQAASAFFRGCLLEFLQYNRSLADAELTMLRGYFAAKWVRFPGAEGLWLKHQTATSVSRVWILVRALRRYAYRSKSLSAFCAPLLLQPNPPSPPSPPSPPPLPPPPSPPPPLPPSPPPAFLKARALFINASSPTGPASACLPQAANARVSSPNGAFVLTLQASDSNLCLFAASSATPLWCASMQTTTAFGAGGFTTWSTCAACARWLCLQPDGNLVLYDSGSASGGAGAARWTSAGTPPGAAAGRLYALWIDDQGSAYVATADTVRAVSAVLHVACFGCHC